MEKVCDHRSVGVLVEKNGHVLIIERKKFPAGFALPAGHLDGDNFRASAERELREETGIEAIKFEHLFSVKLPNPCRRAGGTYHQWQLFRAADWRGELKRAEDETKSIEWASIERLRSLALRTENFAKKNNIALSDITALTSALSQNLEWQSSPGLEPVWFYFLKHMRQI